MFGESSMNSGAFCNLFQKLLSVFHRSAVMSSARRIAASGMLVSAEMMRCASSTLLISSENTIDVIL